MPADPAVDIAVFARAPIAGQAKTRLIPRLGAAGAARLQRQLIERTLARAQSVRGARVTLWTTADDADTRALAEAVRAPIRLQQGPDLGARMSNAFAQTLDGERPMLLIGTDCPAQTGINGRRLLSHRALVHRPENVVRPDHAQEDSAGRLVDAPVMARGAKLLVRRFARVRFLGQHRLAAEGGQDGNKQRTDAVHAIDPVSAPGLSPVRR